MSDLDKFDERDLKTALKVLSAVISNLRQVKFDVLEDDDLTTEEMSTVVNQIKAYKEVLDEIASEIDELELDVSSKSVQ